MAISVVQCIKAETGSGTSYTGNITPTAGNALVVPAYTGGTSSYTLSPSISDNKNSAYTKDASGNGANSQAGHHALSISSVFNVVGAATVVTIATGVNGSGGVAFIYEISGISAIDSASPAVKITSTAGTSVTTNSETNANANAIFIGAFGLDLGSGTATLTLTSSGWSQDNSETNASSFDAAACAHKIVSTIAAQTMTYTVTSAAYAAGIACYKAPSAAVSLPKVMIVSPEISLTGQNLPDSGSLIYAPVNVFRSVTPPSLRAPLIVLQEDIVSYREPPPIGNMYGGEPNRPVTPPSLRIPTVVLAEDTLSYQNRPIANLYGGEPNKPVTPPTLRSVIFASSNEDVFTNQIPPDQVVLLGGEPNASVTPRSLRNVIQASTEDTITFTIPPSGTILGGEPNKPVTPPSLRQVIQSQAPEDNLSYQVPPARGDIDIVRVPLLLAVPKPIVSYIGAEDTLSYQIPPARGDLYGGKPNRPVTPPTLRSVLVVPAEDNLSYQLPPAYAELIGGEPNKPVTPPSLRSVSITRADDPPLVDGLYQHTIPVANPSVRVPYPLLVQTDYLPLDSPSFTLIQKAPVSPVFIPVRVFAQPVEPVEDPKIISIVSKPPPKPSQILPGVQFLPQEPLSPYPGYYVLVFAPNPKNSSGVTHQAPIPFSDIYGSVITLTGSAGGGKNVSFVVQQPLPDPVVPQVKPKGSYSPKNNFGGKAGG